MLPIFPLTAWWRAVRPGWWPAYRMPRPMFVACLLWVPVWGLLSPDPWIWLPLNAAVTLGVNFQGARMLERSAERQYRELRANGHDHDDSMTVLHYVHGRSLPD